MKTLIAMAVMSTLPLSVLAKDYVTGKYDAEAVRLLREMATVLPLIKTELEMLAPSCSVARKEGLTWEQAVAEANARFGTLQPQRAAFLRRYLGRGSPLSYHNELQMRDSGVHVGTGSGTSMRLVPRGPMKPVMNITIWSAREVLNVEPMLSLEEVEIDGTKYHSLQFDAEDRLIYAERDMPALADGTKLSLTQGSQGTDGQFYYVATIKGPGSESETVYLNPDFTLRERWVKAGIQHNFRESYETGVLRNRKHYSTRQTDLGTETFVHREETFR